MSRRIRTIVIPIPDLGALLEAFYRLRGRDPVRSVRAREVSSPPGNRI